MVIHIHTFLQMKIKETGDILPVCVRLINLCSTISLVPEPAYFVPANLAAVDSAPAGKTGGKVAAVQFQTYPGFTGESPAP